MRRTWRILRIILIVTLAFGGLVSHAAATAEPAAPSPQGSEPGGGYVPTTPLAPLPKLQADSAPQATFGQTLDQMDRLAPILNELQGKLDASQFDLNQLGARLEYDPQKIIEFVGTQIAFEQYPGVLRGDLGTLIGRAGNACDKALLLRRLLDDAGVETRLVRTTLTDAQARTLVAQMALPRSPAPPVADPAVVANIRGQLQALAGTLPAGTVDPSTLDKYAVARQLISGDTSLILDGLSHAGVKLGQDAALDDLVKEAGDYVWVQYRLGSFDKWIDVHPAFADPAAAPTGLKIEKFYRDTLPDDLYQRVRINVTVEQKLGDKLIATPIVANWERTSAELAGHPVTFQNEPDNLDPLNPMDVATLISKAAVFIPVMDGAIATRAFDLHGSTYDASMLSLGIIGLAQSGQATNAAAAQAAEALGGNSTAQDPNYVTLTAEWIDYTLVAPGGQETSFRRYVLDRVGEANRSQGSAVLTDQTPLQELAKALLTSYTIMALPGEYSPAYISHRAVARSLTELKIRSYFKPDGTLPQFPQDELRELSPMEDVILNGAFANANAPDSGIVAYRAAPALVVYEQGLRPARPQETAYQRVDVLKSARRVLSVKGGTVAPAPEEAVRIGVWETLAERSVLRQLAAPSSSLDAIRQALAAGIPLVVLKPGDAEALKGLAHSAATQASVQRDLDAGYVVIIPQHPTEAAAPTGWWRVNPATGETLGITTGGYGDSMVEYAITLLFASTFGFLGYSVCRQGGGSGSCCLGETVLWAVVGVILGFGIGAAAGYITAWGWGFGFLIGDVGLGAGTLAIPSICEK